MEPRASGLVTGKGAYFIDGPTRRPGLGLRGRAEVLQLQFFRQLRSGSDLGKPFREGRSDPRSADLVISEQRRIGQLSRLLREVRVKRDLRFIE
jgi:hypothetical protein